MKKQRGDCPRCGETTVGVKNTGFSGKHKNRGRGKAARPEKKGSVKCLSCQSCIGVRLN